MLASDLIGRRAHGEDGHDLGVVVDLLATQTPDGSLLVTTVITSHRRRLRLLGYERPEVRGPWIVAALARALQGPVRDIPIGQIRSFEPIN